MQTQAYDGEDWNDIENSIEVKAKDPNITVLTVAEYLNVTLVGSQVIMSGKKKTVTGVWLPMGSRLSATMAFDDGTSTRLYLPTPLHLWTPENEVDYHDDLPLAPPPKEISTKNAAFFLFGTILVIVLLFCLRMC